MKNLYYTCNGKTLYLKAHYEPNIAFYISFVLTLLTIIPSLLVSPFFLLLTFGLAVFTALIFSYCKVYWIHEGRFVRELPKDVNYKILKTFTAYQRETYYYIEIKKGKL